MPLVVDLCSCSPMTTAHIGAPEEGFRCNCFSLLLHVSAGLAVNCCCLETKNSGMGVCRDSLISEPHEVVGSMPRIDPACQLKRSWRSSRLLTSLGSHNSSLQYIATAWTLWQECLFLPTTTAQCCRGLSDGGCMEIQG